MVWIYQKIQKGKKDPGTNTINIESNNKRRIQSSSRLDLAMISKEKTINQRKHIREGD